MNFLAVTTACLGALAPIQEPQRPALPGPEAIAKLPADGGAEFNRLVFEKSPYLLQHARNPVDWYAWGETAFEAARRLDRPIFLSIGYSTCHWCHVMEHESFEDAEVAALLNANFICIKVDREERPDVDQVYMTVTQTLSGSGGWPMTVVMTPDRKPFFAGTYFPKSSAGGRPGMLELLPALADAWKTQREAVVAHAESIVTSLRAAATPPAGALPGQADLQRGFLELQRRFDAQEGGFGTAPKFPVPHELRFLLRRHARGETQALAMVELSLHKMAQGGIHDQLGGGFHRYSTDRQWLVPHFEKMLYDQALLTLAYVEAWTVTGKHEYRSVAEDVLAYVQRDLTSPQGGFLSAEDADSEGEEGRFYVWTPAQVAEVLGEAAAAQFCAAYDVTSAGNLPDRAGKPTGQSILHPIGDWEALARASGLEPAEFSRRLAAARGKLFAAREGRVHPFKDDKVLCDWNGLAIAAFASAARAFDQPRYAQSARRAADFVLTHLRDANGRLLKRYRAGEAAMPAVLDDYAFLVYGLLELYETDFDTRWLAEALRLNAEMRANFADLKNGGFFLSAADGEALFLRSKEHYDGAIPSGNSVAALNLLRIAHLTGELSNAKQAEGILKSMARDLAQGASGHTQALIALDFLVGPAREIVIAGEPAAADTKALLDVVRSRFLPNSVVLLRPPGDAPPIARLAPFTLEQRSRAGLASAYLCSDFTCQAPVTGAAALIELLEQPPAGQKR